MKMKNFYFLIATIFVLMSAVSIEAATTNQNTPTISGVSPNSAVAVGYSSQNSSLSFVLTISGSNFSNTARVKFGARTIIPFERSPSTLKIRVPFTSIATPGEREVVVVNRPPNGNQSNGYLFQVVEGHPVITSISPTSTTVGTMPPNNKITIRGRGFRENSQTRYSGQDRPMEHVSQNEMKMTINQDDVATRGHFSVIVNNPGNTPPEEIQM